MSEPRQHGPGQLHAPVMRQLRDAGREPKAFGVGHAKAWTVAAFGGLVLTAVLPFMWPATLPYLQRTTPLMSLFFLLGAGAAWLRMGRRSLPIAGGMVLLLYAATSWTWFIWDLHDFFVIALLSSFAIFALAGFNLVFIMEEVVFDLHRHLPLVHRPWSFLPALVTAALAIGIPIMTHFTGVRLPAMWVTAVAASAILWGWWIVRALNPIRDGPILRELHMLATASIVASGISDLASKFSQQTGLVPSIVAYGVLIGTWLYVSYTTLQRTHFLLPSKDVAPWILILLSASFALLNHSQLQYSYGGTGAVSALLSQRALYLVAGIWVGMAFYVVQAIWRVLRRIRDDARMAPEGRVFAGQLARIFESLFTVERQVEFVAKRVYTRFDEFVPGRRWSLDADDGLTLHEDE